MGKHCIAATSMPTKRDRIGAEMRMKADVGPNRDVITRVIVVPIPKVS